MGILETIGALLAALGAAWFFGRRSQRKDTAAKGAKDYAKERKKIDAEIGSVGSTDAERIKRLQSIAKRRGTGKN
jgi:hypothetical protein